VYDLACKCKAQTAALTGGLIISANALGISA
jgi:hypothetical protein